MVVDIAIHILLGARYIGGGLCRETVERKQFKERLLLLLRIIVGIRELLFATRRLLYVTKWDISG